MNYGLVRQELLDELKDIVASLDYWEAEHQIAKAYPDEIQELQVAEDELQEYEREIVRVAKKIVEEQNEN